MKKLFTLLFVLVTTTTLWAYDFQVDGIYYNILEGNNVEVTTGGYTGRPPKLQEYTGSLNIPTTVTYNGTTYHVTRIGTKAFQNSKSLTSVTIPNSITGIGYMAFDNCGVYNDESNWKDDVLYVDNCLIRVRTTKSGAYTIKNQTKLVAGGAFEECSALTSVSIPNSVINIGMAAFQYCSSLMSLELPNSIECIENETFYKCTSLTMVTIPNSVTSIGSGAFSYCSSLTSITIPSSVTTIGENAFVSCISLTSIALPNSITTLETNVFNSCSSLKSITIPNGVSEIGTGAFKYCTSLVSVVVPSSVGYIQTAAFEGCSALTSITLSDGLISIGNYSFVDCVSLRAITIPSSVTWITFNAFNGCYFLRSGFVNNSSLEDSGYWGARLFSDEIDGMFIDEGVLFKVKKDIVTANIPNIVKSISSSAFSGCTSLTSITIPISVTNIGSGAFADCSSIKKVVWDAPNCSTYYFGVQVESFAFGDNITTIPAQICSGMSNLTSVTIGRAVTNIDKIAFEGCSNIKHVVWNAKQCIRYSFGAQVETFVFGKNVEMIPYRICYGMNKLTSIIIPENITILGSEAFTGCTALTDIEWNVNTNADLSIKEFDPFRNIRSQITSFTIGNHVETIPDDLCREMSNLTSITIPSGVTSIGNDAFYGCSNIKDIVWNAHECNSCVFDPQVETFVFGEGVRVIPASICKDMTKLSSINIPSSVTSIGEEAFAGCRYLYDIYCYAMVPPLAETNSFANYNVNLYVPCESLKSYQMDMVFGSFKYSQCIDSEDVNTNGVVVTPSTNDVTFIWPTEATANTYSIVIKKDNNRVCSLTFNSDGQLLNIAYAPGRESNRPAQYAEYANNGYRFTVTGLESGTKYAYDINVKDAANKTIRSYSGEFATKSVTNVEDIVISDNAVQKLFRDGQLFIIREGKTYNVLGNRL